MVSFVVDAEGEAESRTFGRTRIAQDAVEVVGLGEAGHEEQGAVVEGEMRLLEGAFVSEA